MDKDFESIRSKVLKLQALAERGEKGEAINARRLLDQLLAKYGVSLEEIVEAQEEKQPYTFNVKENGYGFTLFTQCYFNVTNEKRMSYRQRRRYVTVELTKMQYVELKALYDWHYKQLTKDMKRMQKEFTEAYIQKHRIFGKHGDDNSEEERELSPEDLQRLLRMLNYKSEELYISQRKRNPLCKGYKPMTAETDRARDATGVRRANLPPRTMNFKFYNYGSNNRK